MRFSTYRSLIAIVVLTGLLGYSVIQAEKKEAPIDEFIRLHNNLITTFIELNELIVNNKSLLREELTECADTYKEDEKCQKIIKSISTLMWHKIRYDSMMKKEGD